MQTEFVTKKDLHTLKHELLLELRTVLQPSSVPTWMRSSDVQKLLKCSPGTLQNLRITGTLPFTKLGGTLYYKYSDILQLLGTSAPETK